MLGGNARPVTVGRYAQYVDDECEDQESQGHATPQQKTVAKFTLIPDQRPAKLVFFQLPPQAADQLPDRVAGK